MRASERKFADASRSFVSNKDVEQDELDNLADALTEDILNTPDNELLREVEEDYGDPRALASKFDQILERAEKQVFGTARSAASPQVRSSVLDLPYRLLEWFSTLFGSGPGRSGTQFQLFSVNRMVWAGAAAVLIVLILAPAVFRSMSEFDERSRQLAALEKEQLARSEQLVALEKEQLAKSEQLAALEKEQLARSEQLAAQGKELLARLARSEKFAVQTQMSASPPAEPSEMPAAQATTEPSEMPAAQAATSEPSILCETFESLLLTVTKGIPPILICADADLAFWQNLVSEIYEHRWRQLDTNGQEILRQGQDDWLRNMRVDCNAAFQVPVSGTEMARAKSCVLQSTKERVAVLSNN
jgi:hypothetical protein